APPNEGCLADAILRQGVWFPPPLLNLLPLLRPYAVRDNACRPRGNANEGERWGLPDGHGFFRDDNSLIKSMPFSFPVSGTENPYNGRKIRNGFVASHGWRKIHDGISHGNPLTYSFIGNVVWLPKEIAPFTDQEGGFGQHFIKAVSWAIFRDFAAHSNMGPFLEEIWSQLAVPDVSVLPANCASRVSYFSLDAKRFSDT